MPQECTCPRSETSLGYTATCPIHKGASDQTAVNGWNAERIAELRHRLVGPMQFPAGHLRDDLFSLLDELEGYHDAFEDVMGALAKALDGDDSYAERPAELVWRLRDQRDEAQEAERSKIAECQLASEQVAECAAELESTRAALAEAVTTIHDLRARGVPR